MRSLFDEKIRHSGAQNLFQTVLEAPNRPPNKKYVVPAFFEDRFVEKEIDLSTYKPSSEELGYRRHFCIKKLRTLN